jgi:phosphopantothenoylcysteine decarboxylase/phosphopantothenate--cysteine ligase
MLAGKNILLGISGSIAAYKSVELVRRLKDEGAKVKVVLTEAACQFVSPLTFESVSRASVDTSLFANPFTHITLSEQSELFIVAPATANTIAKLATGIADNLLTTLWSAYSGPALVAPAMNWRMYENLLAKLHLSTLQKQGITIVGPISGSLACGEENKMGRMADIPDILEHARALLSNKDLSRHKILVTAGPTREPIDPVRFISNRSSGKMGFAIARMALRRGAEVTIVSGPSNEKPPMGAIFIPVETAYEMNKAVMNALGGKTVLIMAAAVADFRPSTVHSGKVSKYDMQQIHLERTADILASVGKQKTNRLIVVGFAAETDNALRKGKEKLIHKNLDLIVVNDVTLKGAGFDTDTNIVTILQKDGTMTDYPLLKKVEVANIILDTIQQYANQMNKPSYQSDSDEAK